ncbi:MAG: hypothetical protein K1X64_18320, partial [Myxococcaceae bacterium]|nr:hypothetical protein [Myxococcaceae bacterium]
CGKQTCCGELPNLGIICGLNAGCVSARSTVITTVSMDPHPVGASNNPIAFVDPDGLLDTYSECIKKHPGNPEACGGDPAPAPAPKPPRPVPPLPTPGTDKLCEEDKDKKDRCAGYYEKCIDAGGGNKPGNHKGQTLCGACLDYCTSNGFWPHAIPTMNGRTPCPGG